MRRLLKILIMLSTFLVCITLGMCLFGGVLEIENVLYVAIFKIVMLSSGVLVLAFLACLAVWICTASDNDDFL